jgi:nucleoside-diphosphate-sugar epimerase
MKALIIGGTGTISSAISKLALQKGWDLYLLNRGRNTDRVPDGAKVITADINDEADVKRQIGNMEFDVVADFIAFKPEQVERDVRLFNGRTSQYIFISSASAYQKPLSHYIISESTPLINPYWEYSRDKIACEDYLVSQYRNNGFPVTVIRPSHTYDERGLPLALHGEKGSWQVVDRILKGKPVMIHGDGTSLWVTTYNTDFARAFIGIMGNRKAIGEAIQIMSDEALTWNAMYDLIGDALGVKVNKMHVSSDFLIRCKPDLNGSLLGDKSNSVCFDTSKIKSLVPGFRAEVSFAEGARKCVEYLLSHKEAQIPDEKFEKFCDNMFMFLDEAATIFNNL